VILMDTISHSVRALHYIVNHFPYCLFPSIIDDTHIECE
jgi:hypothetical protein